MASRQRARRWRVAVVTLSAVAVLDVGASAQAADDRAKEPVGAVAVPSDGRTSALQATAERVAEVADRLSALGLYVDSAKSEIVVVAPSEGKGSAISSRDFASFGAVRVARSGVSAQAVEAFNKMIEARKFHPNAGSFGYASYLDVARGTMVIETDAPSDVIAVLVRAFPGRVETVASTPQRLSRQSDSSPHWGGAAIKSGGSTCSSGFTVRNGAGTRFMVTAGHCFGAGAFVTSPVSPFYYWGSVVNRAPFPTWDMELIGGNTYDRFIYVGGAVGTPVRVVGASNPVVGGTGYCHSGQTTNEGCGHTVTSLNAQFCDAAGCTPGLIAYRNGISLRAGDSGSPFYSYVSGGVQIRGLNIAVAGTTNYAEKWSTVASRFGVTIVT